MDYDEEEKNNFDPMSNDDTLDEPLDIPDEPLEDPDDEMYDPDDQYH